jgi:hypothetical protein
MRALNRLLALLLGLALIGGGLVWAAEVVAAALGPTPRLAPWPGWVRSLESRSFSDPVAQRVFGTIGFIGLLLLVAQAWPWRKKQLSLANAKGVRWSLQRRSVERYLAARIVNETAATAARVRLYPGRRLRVHLSVAAPRKAAPEVRERTDEALTRLGIFQPRRLKLRLHSSGKAL